MYVIQCKDNNELFEGSRLMARPGNMTVIVNEKDPADWHGSLTISKPLEAKLVQSLKTGGAFVVAFEHKGQRLRGMITVTETPADMGPFLWVEFRGNDIFHLR